GRAAHRVHEALLRRQHAGPRPLAQPRRRRADERADRRLDRVLLPGHRPDDQVRAGIRQRSRDRPQTHLRVPVTVRVLVVGDGYMPASVFSAALAGLGSAVSVTELQIGATDAAAPRTASERALREYVGDPADLVAAVAGHDALLVHGAPVSAEVLDAAPLRLVCCARGGPVNVDVAAASRRGIPVTNAPGRNAEAVAELTIALALMLIRGVPAAARYLTAGGQLAESTYEGSQFIGCEAAGLTLGLVGLGNVGREVAARAGPLGFALLGYDPVPPAVVPPGVDLVGWDELLSRSRLISVHARATPGNRHLVGP